VEEDLPEAISTNIRVQKPSSVYDTVGMTQLVVAPVVVSVLFYKRVVGWLVVVGYMRWLHALVIYVGLLGSEKLTTEKRSKHSVLDIFQINN